MKADAELLLVRTAIDHAVAQAGSLRAAAKAGGVDAPTLCDWKAGKHRPRTWRWAAVIAAWKMAGLV